MTLVYAAIPAKRFDLLAPIASGGSNGELWDYLLRFVPITPGDLFPSLLRPSGATVALAGAWLLVAVALIAAGARRGAPVARA